MIYELCPVQILSIHIDLTTSHVEQSTSCKRGSMWMLEKFIHFIVANSLAYSNCITEFNFLNMDCDSTQFKVGGTSAEKVTVLKPKNEKC